jgi:predicted HTH domain antitoxin
MATVTLDLPDELFQALPFTPENAGRELRLAAALQLCSRGELSVGWGAVLAGLTYGEFMEASARRECELFPVDLQELQREVRIPIMNAEAGGSTEEFSHAQPGGR